MLRFPGEIQADNLMIAKSQTMVQSWGIDKQATWGMLTYSAIMHAVQKLQRGEIKSLEELLHFLGEARQTIGAILSHPIDCGVQRKHASFTPIDPYGSYADQFEEFKAFIHSLTQNSSELFESEDISITLKGISQQKQTYPRTKITLPKDPAASIYTLRHVWEDGFALQLKDAGQIFKQLNQTELSAEQKGQMIKKISFLVADTMPWERGSASGAQMAFHVLEKHHLSSFSYFAKPKSKFGKSAGLQFDLVAMLSPNFATFNDYLTQQIIDDNVHVNDIKPDELLQRINEKRLSKAQLLEIIQLLKNQLSQFDQSIRFYYFTDKVKDKFEESVEDKIKRMLAALTNIETNLSQSKEQDVVYIQPYLNAFMYQLSQDDLFYPAFYASVPVNFQQHWLPPSKTDHLSTEIEAAKSKLLQSTAINDKTKQAILSGKLTKESKIDILHFLAKEENSTALIIALQCDMGKDIISDLISESSSNISVQNKQGFTALIWAIRNRADIDIVAAILTKQIDVNLRTHDGLYSALMFAAFFSAEVKVVEALLKKSDVNQQNAMGETAFMLLLNGTNTFDSNDDKKVINAFFEQGGSRLRQGYYPRKECFNDSH